jgi:hypothetical protein
MTYPKQKGVPLYRQSYSYISRERTELRQKVEAQQRYISVLNKKLKRALEVNDLKVCTKRVCKKNTGVSKRRITALQRQVSNLEHFLQKSQLACLALIHAVPELKSIRKKIYKEIVNQ